MTKRISVPTDDQEGFDIRLQDRFVVKGRWLSAEVVKSINSLDDLQSAIAGFEEKQPALGSFSPEELKRVQKNFPYPTKK